MCAGCIVATMGHIGMVSNLPVGSHQMLNIYGANIIDIGLKNGRWATWCGLPLLGQHVRYGTVSSLYKSW